PAKSRRLKYVLRHCSNKLEKLTLHVNVVYTDNEKDEAEEKGEEEEKKKKKEAGELYQELHESTSAWTSLRVLNVHYGGDMSTLSRFWLWLWRRCKYLKMLEIDDIRDNVA
ncbi:hypothetical protein BGX31_003084, partial [Mortierella sp. GBA43]